MPNGVATPARAPGHAKPSPYAGGGARRHVGGRRSLRLAAAAAIKGDPGEARSAATAIRISTVVAGARRAIPRQADAGEDEALSRTADDPRQRCPRTRCAPPFPSCRLLGAVSGRWPDRDGNRNVGCSRTIPGHGRLVGLPRKRSSAPDCPAYANSPSSALASCRTRVPKTSVNQP
jgi:hypothetical protein